MIFDVLKVMLPATTAFAIGIILAPIVTHYLYKHRAWKKRSGKGEGLGGGGTPVFDSLHKEKEVGTPRMGGIVVWGSATLTIIGIWILSKIFPTTVFEKLEFLSRNQTWIPLFTLLAGAAIGLLDDFMEIQEVRRRTAGGFSLTKRLLLVSSIGLFVGWWFFEKLEISTIAVPFYGTLELGLLFIPFFVFVMLSVYAGGVIDGIDGLSGGVFASIFASYAAIAFWQQQIDLAAFNAMIVGAIFAFLWFNIPPARFYLTETGSMALTITLAVVAFMSDSLSDGIGVLVLPIIAFPLVITVLSVVLQILSKKLRAGKKVFIVAPLHHHFEAIGWPSYKVTMRYWVLSVVFAIIGFSIALIG